MKKTMLFAVVAAAVAATSLVTFPQSGTVHAAAPAPIPSGSLSITGTIWYLPPGFIYQAPGATVTARRTADGRTVSTTADSRGAYRLNLIGGEWVITATGRYGRNISYQGTCGSRALVYNHSIRTAAGFNINMRPR